jgi:hypothetical protein
VGLHRTYSKGFYPDSFRLVVVVRAQNISCDGKLMLLDATDPISLVVALGQFASQGI